MTYLFHLWVNGWIVPFAIQAYHHFHRDVASPYLVVLVCVVSANVLGLVIHLIVERPITRALRGLKFGGQKPSLPITL
jgi:peptidoglycan/LPS O-acetylase OafA/YrhL